jgi:hypothetical protein
VACEKGFAGDAAPPQTGTGDTPVEIAKAGIDTTISLGDWLKAHPRDSVAKEYRENRRWDADSFCRVAVAKSTFANRRLTRSAVFHAFLPVGEKLPEDTTKFAERFCRLRTIFLETEVLDSATALTLSDSVTSLIESQLGVRAKPGAKTDQSASRDWLNGRTWSTPGATVVIGVAPLPDPPPQGDSTKAANNSRATRVISPRRVVMIAYAPGSSFQHEGSMTARYDEAERRAEESRPATVVENPDVRDADSAIAWARLPSVAADLKVVLGVLRRSEPRTPRTDSALIRAFSAIRDTAPTLEPRRRAAALLAAELVRFALIPVLQYNAGAQDRILVESLYKIVHGPGKSFSADDDNWTRAWLWEAYRLDSLGRAGHLAFVRLLERGFRQDAMCAEDVGFYTTMIERGEAYLRRGTKDPLVHFYVGVANKSIFDLAHTTPGIWVEQPPTRAEAEAARVRAIDHFRAAFPGLRDRSMRNEAWHYATRLLLGQSGSAWMFCASD